jgi:hypothetical protein
METAVKAAQNERGRRREVAPLVWTVVACS